MTPSQELPSCTRGVFPFLLALALFTFRAEQGGWLSCPGFQWVDAVTLALLLAPMSRVLLVSAALAQLVEIFVRMPYVNTNRTLTCLVMATLCLSLPYGWLGGRHRRGRDLTAAWRAACEPLLRVLVLVVYFFAFWHKLNVDFLDVDVSCGTELYGSLVANLPWIPLPRSAVVHGFVIWATLVIEIGLPLLLAFCRTRTLGFLFAVLFHWVLGLALYFGFSMTMTALLYLFAPPSWTQCIVQRPAVRHLVERLSRRRAMVPRIVVLVALLTAWALPTWTLRHVFWLGFTTLPAFLLAFWWLGRSDRRERTFTARERVPAFLWPIPLFAIFTGLNPYLGLKTESAFAMYSNLRTEGGTNNHVLMPQFDFAGYQTRLVRVLDSNHGEVSRLAEGGLEVPLLVLQREVREAHERGFTGIRVRYRDAAGEHDVAPAERDPILGYQESYWERKWLWFRQIQPRDANTCCH